MRAHAAGSQQTLSRMESQGGLTHMDSQPLPASAFQVLPSQHNLSGLASMPNLRTSNASYDQLRPRSSLPEEMHHVGSHHMLPELSSHQAHHQQLSHQRHGHAEQMLHQASTHNAASAEHTAVNGMVYCMHCVYLFFHSSHSSVAAFQSLPRPYPLGLFIETMTSGVAVQDAMPMDQQVMGMLDNSSGSCHQRCTAWLLFDGFLIHLAMVQYLLPVCTCHPALQAIDTPPTPSNFFR